jgi:hypothetical protein
MEAEQILSVIGLTPVVTSSKYVPYRHSMLLMETAYRALPHDSKRLPVGLPTMMQAAGYTNRTKFLRRIKKSWLQAQGRIPWPFVEYLGITREDLCLMLEFDRQDFRQVLMNANRPTTFHFRLMTCVYRRVRLPENCTENDAISFVQQFMKNQPDHVRKAPAWFTSDNIKTVFVHEDGRVSTSYYKPAIIFEHNFVVFERKQMPGTVRIR